MASFRLVPIDDGSVDPARVVGFLRIGHVGKVIEHADLVAVVQQGDAAEGHDHAMQQQDQVNAVPDRGLIVLFQGDLQAGQRCQ